MTLLLTCPVMHTTGEESIIAVAMPVTMLVAPGPDVATRPRVAVGHVGGALFVPHQDVMQFRFAERVVHRKNRAAGITKNVAHAETRERFAKYFRTGKL